MISNTVRNPKAVLLAQDIRADLTECGYTVWLGLKLNERDRVAMKKAVVNSKNVIAILSGPCIYPEYPNWPTEYNAYMQRYFCLEELVWAMEAGVTIVPVVNYEIDISAKMEKWWSSGPAGRGLDEHYGAGTLHRIISTLKQQPVIVINRQQWSDRQAGIKRIIYYRSTCAWRKVILAFAFCLVLPSPFPNPCSRVPSCIFFDSLNGLEGVLRILL